MKTRYQQSSLARQLAVVNRLLSWNPDKWVQEWCDLLKELLSLQVRDLEGCYGLPSMACEHLRWAISVMYQFVMAERRSCYNCGKVGCGELSVPKGGFSSLRLRSISGKQECAQHLAAMIGHVSNLMMLTLTIFERLCKRKGSLTDLVAVRQRESMVDESV
ncbi:hypothetical protein V1525DRAFT_82836 [Lipomyces kononenkoae]|uniref:Uncharacterized protein n=1 Tax=Lipomyces kononenkoae TaxID=34357 RepID=A0ACC3SR71_LIPKO